MLAIIDEAGRKFNADNKQKGQDGTARRPYSRVSSSVDAALT